MYSIFVVVFFCTARCERSYRFGSILRKDAENYGEEDEPLKQTRSHKILEKRGKLSCVSWFGEVIGWHLVAVPPWDF
jgi:hypothetical protein